MSRARVVHRQSARQVSRIAEENLFPSCVPPNKALQVAWHSAFQSESGRISLSTFGPSGPLLAQGPHQLGSTACRNH
jgi:hypothetical protein